MDIRIGTLTSIIIGIAAVAIGGFKVENLVLQDELDANSITGFPTYVVYDSSQDSSCTLFEYYTPLDGDTLEMSYWLAYHFARYGLCDYEMFGGKGFTNGTFSVFRVPIDEYVAQRCRLLIFPTDISTKATEILVYKFYHGKCEEKHFKFALYIDMERGSPEMSVHRKGAMRRMGCGRNNETMFFLNWSEKQQQEKAMLRNEVIRRHNMDKAMSIFVPD